MESENDLKMNATPDETARYFIGLYGPRAGDVILELIQKHAEKQDALRKAFNVLPEAEKGINAGYQFAPYFPNWKKGPTNPQLQMLPVMDAAGPNPL